MRLQYRHIQHKLLVRNQRGPNLFGCNLTDGHETLNDKCTCCKNCVSSKDIWQNCDINRSICKTFLKKPHYQINNKIRLSILTENCQLCKKSLILKFRSKNLFFRKTTLLSEPNDGISTVPLTIFDRDKPCIIMLH